LGNPRQLSKSNKASAFFGGSGNMDKIETLREILTLDPKNSFARYGIAMELVNRGQIEAALEEYSTLLANDPDYTAGYFMSAQTLSAAGRTAEAIERLKAGIASAARGDNRHAISEMQAMLDELDR
jgi:predicted Zn-dependent protease